MNSRCFKIHLSVYSMSSSLSNVVSMSWVQVLHKTTEISQCHVVVVQFRTTITKECTKKLFFQSKPKANFFSFFFFAVFVAVVVVLTWASNEEPSFLFYLDIFLWFSKACLLPVIQITHKFIYPLFGSPSYLKISFNKFLWNLTQHRISIIN